MKTATKQRSSKLCPSCHRRYLVTRDVRLMNDGVRRPHCKTCHCVTDNSLNLKARF